MRPAEGTPEPVVVRLAAAALAVLIGAGGAVADAAPVESHGLSAFGELAYPEGFEHFAYTNPRAPKGGAFSTFALGTFDSLNPYIRKGNAAEPTALALLHDSLMARAFDHPDAMYGLVAERVRLPADRQWVEFILRPEARFADGSPVRAEDVVFSINTLKTKAAPRIRLALEPVASVGIVAPGTVRITFAGGGSTRDLPLEVAQLPILSERYWADRDFAESSLDPPIGSGPYRVGTVERGRRLELVRRPDYWGRDLPVNRGRFNFDRITIEYYRDHSAAFEGFKGGTYSFREEYFSKLWATAYDFPAVEEGRVIRDRVPDGRPSGTQGFWFNTRLERFSDVRVREAIALGFDFEWMNRALFFGQYHRTDSFFEGSPHEASGAAGPAERTLLSDVGAELDPAQLESAYVPPRSDGSGQDRRLFRRASRLLDAAGWMPGEDGIRRDAGGERLAVEFLMDTPAFERIIQPYVQNLRRLGVDAVLTMVDDAQYESRRKAFDYDVITTRFSMAPTPGAELAGFFHSGSADQPDSYNLAGIRDPVVDGLVDAVRAARDSESLAVAVSALDRVLRAGHYWVPHWAAANHRIAFWDRFGRPPRKPPYAPAFLDTWWAASAADGTGADSQAGGE